MADEQKMYDHLGHPIVPDADERLRKVEEELAAVQKDLAEVVEFLKHVGYPQVWGDRDRA